MTGSSIKSKNDIFKFNERYSFKGRTFSFGLEGQNLFVWVGGEQLNRYIINT